MGLEAFNKVDITSFQLDLDLDKLRQIGIELTVLIVM